MELDKVRQAWKDFPEMSMEERPILSTDLEELVVKNPFSGGLYLKNRLIFMIAVSGILLVLAIFQLKKQFAGSGETLNEQCMLALLLAYSIYFHTRLLIFSDYSSLLSLPLLSFLGKMQTILEKYILSFRVISLIAGFYLLMGIEWVIAKFNYGAYESIRQNGLYKWLIIIFLSISFYILLLNTVIQKYKKILTVVKSYREAIEVKSHKL